MASPCPSEVQEKIIIERWEMAHSICLEKLFHIRQQKNFHFFSFLTAFRYVYCRELQRLVYQGTSTRKLVINMISYLMTKILYRTLHVKFMWILSLIMKKINRLRFSLDRSVSDKNTLNSYHVRTNRRILPQLLLRIKAVVSKIRQCNFSQICFI